MSVIITHMAKAGTYTTVTQETLEASHTSVYQALKILVISWNDTAIEADINPALALGSIDFNVEVLDSGGRWDSVQRHVDDSSDTSKSSSFGTGPKALPFCAPRFVEMYVSIYQTRKQNVGRVISVGYAFWKV